MPTTNATTAKLALINLLKAQTGAGQLLDGIDVRYAYRGQIGAQCVYGGGWRMDADDAVSEGPGVLVREIVVVSLYVRVLARPACDVEDTDATANQIGTALGSVMKANPKLAGPLTVLGISSGQGDYSTTDDETISIHAYQVRVGGMVSWG